MEQVVGSTHQQIGPVNLTIAPRQAGSDRHAERIGNRVQFIAQLTHLPCSSRNEAIDTVQHSAKKINHAR